ncbi:MAG: UDP-N-acetylglucosamine 2-epimerase (non-hydrolyzing), partial [Aliifodinibius sp.]|nr:UDP-N-acetylglucosamine 2-epimerase (non-hydrolyzing) [candidate division Zixibacteria bacterium]NIT59249.1 UDP-N-acetylglucosamine 2-epimerase (non-hydrolyzing) [Fodinibius sp.]NIW40510.1 UDP-N-acetylglucosamine 2-epimerase (non-hydrolyzing) [candidate division Zixibacteria bacterium]NIX57834.1 UDP-N-acetylglucosamine 2-epimerase (non-hydrolyzing) [candidate division Zixibacteria bacterium]NIY27832.1 UDP-N-acetylglucosamine 2-epimerase (non-hydrolyzing) [Fodinibius sp.]
MIKILLLAGARPDFMKLAPLYFELRKYPAIFNPRIVHTGQHYDYTMSRVFFDQFGLPEPDFFLEVGSGSHAHQTGNIMIKAEEIMESEKPNMVVVFGDVNSTLAGALVASKLCIPIAHLEAGLRSHDKSMPEEINRVVADTLADMLFTTCDDANLNLIKEGVDVDRIFLVGNIIIDTLKYFLPQAEKSKILDKLRVEGERYILVTLHRPSNVDNHENLDKIAEILSAAAERCKIVFPIHPRTRKNLDNSGGHSSILNNKNIILTDPLGYFDFIKLQKNAFIVMTDSGGIQEEATFLGVPCLTLRKNTERMVTVTDGTNKVVGL